MNILVCGYGVVGRFVHEPIGKTAEIHIYDPNVEKYNDNKVFNERYDMAFICVPTDSLPDGSADISLVKETVNCIDAETIVIKSAVPMGTAESFNKDNIVISPEYCGATLHSGNNQGFIVLGGKQPYLDRVAALYQRVKNGGFRIRFTDWRTAELAKYMENCFLALKITFCVEFYHVAMNNGVSYPELREIFIMDERMGDSHTFVYPDKPYYDSHCLNKDVPALINQSEGMACLMSAVHRINMGRKNK